VQNPDFKSQYCQKKERKTVKKERKKKKKKMKLGLLSSGKTWKRKIKILQR
jgi:hypothetical protein